ncbi:MAG TPA: Hsp70 family protein, partial [Nitrospiria bacterium]|nr:Hsp70 family protein [Nitrospiria bacterium]
GIVHVSAKDTATQKEQSIKITASSGLSKDEIDKMLKESQAHAEEDKKKKELAEVKNEADSLIYSVEKSLKDIGDKISAAEKDQTQEKINQTRKALESGEIPAIRSAVEELTKTSHKLAEEMYKKTAAAAGDGAGAGAHSEADPGAQGKKEDVVDATYEEVDKDKK